MGLLSVVFFFVCTRRDVSFLASKVSSGFLLSGAFHQAEGTVCAPEGHCAEGQYCGRGCIFCNSCGLIASIPFDSSLKHGIGSLLLARASGWVKNTEGINKAHQRK